MNVGDIVYVRWYGKVVEGKLLEGEYLGMKLVQIPLDGRKPIALFTPQHVYEDAVDAIAVIPTLETPIQRVILSTDTPSGDFFHQQFVQAKEAISDVMPADDREMLEKFKRENWDAERGHLYIDKLDEFYQLWRMVMKPFGYVEKPILVVPEITESDIEKIAEEFANYDGKLIYVEPEPVSQNDTPLNKPKKSNPTVTQLSLFD